jgi:L-2-hydroxyglutarate oxidase LhgO
MLAFHSRVVSGDVGKRRKVVEVEDTSTGEVTSMATNLLVNSAGLHAERVARSLRGLHACLVPQTYLARGCYFALQGGATRRLSPRRVLV